MRDRYEVRKKRGAIGAIAVVALVTTGSSAGQAQATDELKVAVNRIEVSGSPITFSGARVVEPAAIPALTEDSENHAFQVAVDSSHVTAAADDKVLRYYDLYVKPRDSNLSVITEYGVPAQEASPTAFSP